MWEWMESEILEFVMDRLADAFSLSPSDDQRKEAMEKFSEMIVPWHAVKTPLRWRSVILSLFVPSVSVP